MSLVEVEKYVGNGDNGVGRKKKPPKPLSGSGGGDDDEPGHVVDIERVEKRRIRGNQTDFAQRVLNAVEKYQRCYGVPKDRLKKEGIVKLDSFRSTILKLAGRMNLDVYTWQGPDEDGVECFMVEPTKARRLA